MPIFTEDNQHLMDIFDFVKFAVREERKSIEILLDKLNDHQLEQSTGDETIGDRFRHMIESEYNMTNYLVESDSEDKLEISDLKVEIIRKAAEKSMDRHIETL